MERKVESMLPAFVLALAACGAAPNPRPVSEPIAWTPKPAAESTNPALNAASASNAGGAPSATGTSANSGAPSNGATTTPSAPVKPAPSAGVGANANAATNSNTAPNASSNGSAPAGATQGSNPANAAAPAPNGTLAVAVVAGKPVDVRDLMAQWVHHKSAEALDELDHLVLTRLVSAEAARLGVEIAPELQKSTYEAAVAETEKEIQKRRPGVTLDAWVDQVLGLDPLSYREQMRADALNQLLAERVTRAFLLQSEHAVVRVIVVKSEGDVRAVQDALAKGEAFEDVAKRLSVDGSAKEGGRVPPVVRSDTAMSKLAFETPVGQVSEPRYNQGAWLLAKVEARPEPIQGTWRELAPRVEADLKARGIEELEFSQWRSAMLRRYQVDITPFLKLSGQPVR